MDTIILGNEPDIFSFMSRETLDREYEKLASEGNIVVYVNVLGGQVVVGQFFNVQCRCENRRKKLGIHLRISGKFCSKGMFHIELIRTAHKDYKSNQYWKILKKVTNINFIENQEMEVYLN